MKRPDKFGSFWECAKDSPLVAEMNSTLRPFYNQTFKIFMERRANPRKLVFLSGAIRFADSTIDCLICDISISGAALEFSSFLDIPDHFNLVFKADGTHIPCRVIKRDKERIGVTFDY
jgi:PilZ domain